VALLLTRRYLLGLPLATAVPALAIDIPTEVLPDPWSTRMTRVRTLGPLTSIAAGAVVATCGLPSTRRGRAVNALARRDGLVARC
jgi:hypothetical protein